MSKYIKLEDAIEAVTSLFRVSAIFSGMNDNEKEWREKAEKVLDNLPTIDIVRCQDCKHGEYREDFDNYLCDQLGLGSVNDADFFCSYGERE